MIRFFPFSGLLIRTIKFLRRFCNASPCSLPFRKHYLFWTGLFSPYQTVSGAISLGGLLLIGFSTITFLITHPSALYTCSARFLLLRYELIYIFLDNYKIVVIRQSFFFQIHLRSCYIQTHTYFSTFSSRNLKISLSSFVPAHALHAYVAMGRKYVMYNLHIWFLFFIFFYTTPSIYNGKNHNLYHTNIFKKNEEH